MSRMPFPIWLVAFAAAMIALNLNGFLLFDHDEGAFSEATRGMFDVATSLRPTSTTAFVSTSPS